MPAPERRIAALHRLSLREPQAPLSFLDLVELTGLSNRELGEVLGIHESGMRSMLRGRYAPNPEILERIRILAGVGDLDPTEPQAPGSTCLRCTMTIPRDLVAWVDSQTAGASSRSAYVSALIAADRRNYRHLALDELDRGPKPSDP